MTQLTDLPGPDADRAHPPRSGLHRMALWPTAGPLAVSARPPVAAGCLMAAQLVRLKGRLNELMVGLGLTEPSQFVGVDVDEVIAENSAALTAIGADLEIPLEDVHSQLRAMVRRHQLS